MMVDDGNRLSYSIRGVNVTITSNLDGKTLIKTASQVKPVVTLDRNVVYKHINTLQQLIMQSKLKTFMYKPFADGTAENGIRIVECDHYSYRFIVDGKCAELTEFSFKGQRGFDVQKLLNGLGYVYSILATSDTTLQPTRDIVRRIADVDILVWVYEGHTLVCKVNNINGCTLLNCLVDNDVYRLVYVSVNTKDNRCYIFDSNLNLIFDAPIDKSILTYFHNDTEGIE